MAPHDAPWLIGRLRQMVEEEPERVLYTELATGEDETGRLTAADLAGRSVGVADALAQVGAQPGDRAIVFDTKAAETLAACYGCFAAGVSPIILPAPRRPDQVENRLLPVSRDARPVVLFLPDADTDQEQAVIEQLSPAAEHLLPISEIVAGAPERLPEAPLHPRAFIQYTSGSTAAPRGVMIDHHHLMTNLDMAQDRFQWSPEGCIVSWNPLSHDMGLIIGAFPAVFTGIPVVLMPPAAFVLRPARWLKAVTKYGATHSNAPNFAYELCNERIKDADHAELDLSSWRVALNGAEPVREATKRRFLERFGPRGFRSEAWCPAYGLAEATVFVSANPSSEPSRSVSVDRDALGKGRVLLVEQGTAGASELVGCGTPAKGLEVAVVDPETLERQPDDGVGELWVRGPSVTEGYFGRADDNEGTFGAAISGEPEGRYLRTGDIGFVHEGELYIAGRAKDLIIVHGRNIHAADVELAVSTAHPDVRAGGIAAFSVATDDGDRTVVVVEVKDAARRVEVVKAVREQVFMQLEVPVDEVVLTAPRGVPKTTSGKVQRRECRRQYLEGVLPPAETAEPL